MTAAVSAILTLREHILLSLTHKEMREYKKYPTLRYGNVQHSPNTQSPCAFLYLVESGSSFHHREVRTLKHGDVREVSEDPSEAV